ncbi:hypothetical protein [Arenibaculum pallidiluteum]|uniref:hypothetical protein n=1 Tax=Arenibaculum pallidiluteum TaxID=2812559 RepID=UPI001A96F2D0|nr:hypothetical protein [Arenibaculum pallidiluteum]
MTTQEFVRGAWLVIASVGVTFIAWAIVSGWRDSRNDSFVVKWRFIKVVSVFIGGIGLLAALVSLEQTARTLNDNSAKFLEQEFYRLKFQTSYHRAIACSRNMADLQLKNSCHDFTIIDNSLGPWIMRNRETPSDFVNWRNNDELDSFLPAVNRGLGTIREAKRLAQEPAFLDGEARLRLSVFSAFAVFVAFAGSAGEAIFQFCQERRKRRAAS